MPKVYEFIIICEQEKKHFGINVWLCTKYSEWPRHFQYVSWHLR